MVKIHYTHDRARAVVRRDGDHPELIHRASLLAVEDVDRQRFVGKEVPHPPLIEVRIPSDDECFADHW